VKHLRLVLLVFLRERERSKEKEGENEAVGGVKREREKGSRRS
jgi:hypothetical protein